VGARAGLTCEEVCVLACSVHSRRAAPAIIHPHSVTFAPPGTCSTAKVGRGLTSHLIPVMQRVRRFISPSLAAVCRGVQPIAATLFAVVIFGKKRQVRRLSPSVQVRIMNFRSPTSHQKGKSGKRDIAPQDLTSKRKNIWSTRYGCRRGNVIRVRTTRFVK